MRWLGASWLSFRRSTSPPDRRLARTLLRVIGVALDHCGTWCLDPQVRHLPSVRSFGPSLTHAPTSGRWRSLKTSAPAYPDRDGRSSTRRVPEQSSVRSSPLDAVEIRGGSGSRPPQGFFCSAVVPDRTAGRLVQLRATRPRREAGLRPGMPLQIPAVIAERHGLHLGDELRIPGLPPGSATPGLDIPEFDRVKGINDGYVLMAPSAEAAANILGCPVTSRPPLCCRDRALMSGPISTVSSATSPRPARLGRTSRQCSQTPHKAST